MPAIFWVSLLLAFVFLALSFFTYGLLGLIVFIVAFILFGFCVGWFVCSRRV